MKLEEKYVSSLDGDQWSITSFTKKICLRGLATSWYL